MRPLPPFNARPIKRGTVAKSAVRATPHELLAGASLADRIGKLKVKPRALLQKPQLKVLGDKAPFGDTAGC